MLAMRRSRMEGRSRPGLLLTSRSPSALSLLSSLSVLWFPFMDDCLFCSVSLVVATVIVVVVVLAAVIVGAGAGAGAAASAGAAAGVGVGAAAAAAVAAAFAVTAVVLCISAVCTWDCYRCRVAASSRRKADSDKFIYSLWDMKAMSGEKKLQTVQRKFTYEQTLTS